MPESPLQAGPKDLLSIPSQDVLHFRFHCLTLPFAVQQIDQFIQERKPRQVTLANAYTVALGHGSAPLKDLINRSDLTLADGMSIVWGGRWVGARIPERVAGPDLMEALCALAAQRNYRVFLMGSSKSTLAALKKALLVRWPELSVVGTHSPSMCDRFDESETVAILKEIHEAKPDILFVGMSAPKQEIWIAENLYRIEVPVSLGMGAAFDFLSGRIPRAPQKLRKIGLEWLYRLWCEPRRLWKRYLLGNAVFLSLIFRDALRQRFHRSQASRSL